MFEAEQFVEKVKETCREYVRRLVEEKHTESAAALEHGVTEHPISFEGAPQDTDERRGGIAADGAQVPLHPRAHATCSATPQPM
ncbi:MAG TPA: hypothetical protein EYM39_11070 [Candidatus Latescibacteria bacterium]|nr:hypothetical protein [Candidatus Latescibacterota bacterium]